MSMASKDKLADRADEARIHNTMGKMALYLSNHQSICVSVSGGSDSDIIVHIIATYFREYLPKIHFVFANTGIEYRATRIEAYDEQHEHPQIKVKRVSCYARICGHSNSFHLNSGLKFNL